MMRRNLYAGLLLLCMLAGVAAASGSTQTYIGDTVRLSGYCYTSPTVYLFLTGPNLPANGVALDNINSRADQGGFTEVSVDSNDQWVYNWNTGSLGGNLDAGTYTVWAVDGPNDLSGLSNAEYSTDFRYAGSSRCRQCECVHISRQHVCPGNSPGHPQCQFCPGQCIGGRQRELPGPGAAEHPGLPPGTYLVNVSRFNYDLLSTTATVEAGATTEVTATLRPKTGTLSINTTPEGANITLDGMNVGLSPVTEYGVSAGNHTVNATLAGYVPVETEVTVIADQPVTSTIALTKPASLIPGNLTPLPVPVTIGACAGAVLLFAFFRPRTRP